jgi:DNA topoisomerase VI subunit B
MPKAAPVELKRTTFETSQLTRFFTPKELALEIGHEREQWPLALVKELIDNGLDACENSGTPPQIEIDLEPDALCVRDNGPGLPAPVIERSLDYLTRVSDKAHYVSPTRGQLGNALKCVYAASYAFHGEQGRVTITTGGVCHEITVTLDRIAQQPQIVHTRREDLVVKTGTSVRIDWPDAPRLDPLGNPDSYNRIGTLLAEYHLSNPHAAFTLRHGEKTIRQLPPGAAAWEKWRPNQPTSAHWYTTPERFETLVAAYLTEERRSGTGRTVREFVAEFAGLSGTAKQKAVCEAAGLSGARLTDLVHDGALDKEKLARLKQAMQQESREIKPEALGTIGKPHVTQALAALFSVDPESVRYRRVLGTAAGLPFVLEAAFGMRPRGTGRVVTVALNWSATIRQPIPNLPRILQEVWVTPHDPVALFIHLACPRLEYTDRGKATLALPDSLYHDLWDALERVCADWTKAQRRRDREGQVARRDEERVRKARQMKEPDVKDWVFQVLPAAYAEVAGPRRLPVKQRQLMYKTRELVGNLRGARWFDDDKSFNDVLDAFLAAHPEETADWDVVYDARGHFTEPHTGRCIPLGTLEVRGYLTSCRKEPELMPVPVEIDTDCPTMGPAHRFQFALFVEKEGFDSLYQAVHLAERYDLAIMSTKGMSVRAARALVEWLSEAGVTILVWRDFDKSGFSILRTLSQNSGAYRFKTSPRVIDLGLRLTDIQEWNLQTEPVDYGKAQKDPRIRLRQCGATEPECNFLVSGGHPGNWQGRRCELNSPTNEQHLAMLEQKLQAAGVKKVLPDDDVLERFYCRAYLSAVVQHQAEAFAEKLTADSQIKLPEDLSQQVRRRLEGSRQPWDQVVASMAFKFAAEDEGWE